MRILCWLLLCCFYSACSGLVAPVLPASTACENESDCAQGKRCHQGFCLEAQHSCTLVGLVQPVEACDDGNNSPDDGCTNDCQPARCGDGIHRQDLQEGQPGAEACDDGNDRNDDACSNDCQLARCGDGLIRADLPVGTEGYEDCEDGNDVATDACNNRCQLARCGDGVVRADLGENEPSYEECDDGNDSDNDACLSTCVPARCGDSVTRVDLEPNHPDFEACDDGNDVEEDPCLSNCRLNRCGDGILNPEAEGCDDGNEDPADACSGACQTARCGDGVQRQDRAEGEAGYEACDDGNDDNNDACLNNCVMARCGDGVVRQDLLAMTDPDYENCEPSLDNGREHCRRDCRRGPLRRRLAMDSRSRCLLVDEGSEAGQIWCWGQVIAVDSNVGICLTGPFRGPLRFSPPANGQDDLGIVSLGPNDATSIAIFHDSGFASHQQPRARWGVQWGVLPAPAPVMAMISTMQTRALLTQQGLVYSWDGVEHPAISPLLGLSNIVDISSAVHDQRGVAIDVDGALYHWTGWEHAQHLEEVIHRDTNEAAPLPPLRRIANRYDGSSAEVITSEGQVGTVNLGVRPDYQSYDLPAPAIDVARHSTVACALLVDGTVWCRGLRDVGSCIGEAQPPVFLEYTQVQGLENMVEISITRQAAYCGACALDQAGSVWCWGADYQNAEEHHEDLEPPNCPNQQPVTWPTPLMRDEPRRIEGLPGPE